MHLDGVDAIVFDLGNTLVPFAEREMRLLYRELERVFTDELGPQENFLPRTNAIRDEMIRERETGSLREITLHEFVDSVSAGRATANLVARVHTVMNEHMVRICRIPDGLPALLRRLGDRKLAVLSNYVLTEPIEELVRRAGIEELLVTVEVSATTGYMKPHGSLFRRMSERLDVAPERTLMVGDNFFADIVGGHRAGFKTAQTLEHYRGAMSDPRAPDVKPDFVLKRLDELADRS